MLLSYLLQENMKKDDKVSFFPFMHASMAFASLVCGFFVFSFCINSRARERERIYLSSRLLSWCHFMAYVAWISWEILKKFPVNSGKDVSRFHTFFLLPSWNMATWETSSYNWYTQNSSKCVVKSSFSSSSPTYNSIYRLKKSLIHYCRSIKWRPQKRKIK